MTHPTATVLPVDPGLVKPFGPGTIEHRTANSGYAHLGTYLMEFADGGHADPWTLQYEETIFVAAGELSLLVVNGDENDEIRAGAGELVAIDSGATVRYGGEPGTKLVLSIAPVDWAARAAAGRPRILFLTPFHFKSTTNNAEFDQVVAPLLGTGLTYDGVASHVREFETDHDDYDDAQTAAVVEAVESANAEGYDAIVIACHYDPAVVPARAASKVPVIAPLQLTTSVAAQLGGTFAVVTDVDEAETVIGDLVASYGHADQCVEVRAIGLDGDAILSDTLAAATAVDRFVSELAERGDVAAVVVGCTIVSAAYEQHREKFADHGIVVLNSNLLAMEGAADLAIIA